jgi:hypothetical protein
VFGETESQENDDRMVTVFIVCVYHVNVMVCELHTKFRSEDVNGKDNLEDVGADEWHKFILKVIRQVWTRFGSA